MEETNNIFMSPAINEIAGALSELQGTIEQPKLEKEVSVRMKSGGQYKFKYADLFACAKAAAPVLRANGLAISQIINGGKLITLLSHKSGQWIKSELLLPQQSSDYQAFGSAITYLKRYSYCAILGIVADTDDDANMACGNQATFAGEKPKEPSYTAEQMLKAIAEVNAAKTQEEYHEVWRRWMQAAPALCQKGTDFYKVCATKAQELR